VARCPLEDAYKAVDLDTLTLLLGMMIVVANLRLSGFFAQASAWVMRRAHHPLALLAAVTTVAGVFLRVPCQRRDLSRARAPRPSTNAFVAAQPGAVPARRRDGIKHRFDRNHHRGNPQNMMIGSFSQIPYAQFTASLAPVALVGLVLSFVLIALFHRGEFGGGARLVAEPPPARTYRVLMVRALVATTVLVALFFAGQPPRRRQSSSAVCCC